MIIAGMDEVGRGPLAGPICAVIAVFNVHLEYPLTGVTDSKKLTAKKREKLYHDILRHPNLLDFGVGMCSNEEIDKLGIQKCNHMVFDRAVEHLDMQLQNIEILWVDGTLKQWGSHILRPQIIHEPKADGTYWQVGAASILAKVIRDQYMRDLSREYPQYGWEKNSGYGGAEKHQKALKTFGPTPYHRKTFLKRSFSENHS